MEKCKRSEEEQLLWDLVEEFGDKIMLDGPGYMEEPEPPTQQQFKELLQKFKRRD